MRCASAAAASKTRQQLGTARPPARPPASNTAIHQSQHAHQDGLLNHPPSHPPSHPPTHLHRVVSRVLQRQGADDGHQRQGCPLEQVCRLGDHVEGGAQEAGASRALVTHNNGGVGGGGDGVRVLPPRLKHLRPGGQAGRQGAAWEAGQFACSRWLDAGRPAHQLASCSATTPLHCLHNKACPASPQAPTLLPTCLGGDCVGHGAGDLGGVDLGGGGGGCLLPLLHARHRHRRRHSRHGRPRRLHAWHGRPHATHARRLRQHAHPTHGWRLLLLLLRLLLLVVVHWWLHTRHAHARRRRLLLLLKPRHGWAAEGWQRGAQTCRAGGEQPSAAHSLLAA